MRKLVILIVVILILVSITTCAYAVPVEVQLNGEILNFTDENGNTVNPQIINDRTMVPMRKIFEMLGADIEWDGTNQIVTAIKDNITIELQINNKIAKKIVNGETKEITLDSAPIIIEGRTLVPLRFIAESLGKQVGWDRSYYTAIIIDYNYFSNVLKNNARALYEHLNNEYLDGKEIELNVIRNYIDTKNISNNNISNIKVNISGINTKEHIISMKFSGSNELMQEIIKEKWNESSFYTKFLGDTYYCTSTHDIFKRILDTRDAKDSNTKYKDINLLGNDTDNFEKMLSNWVEIKESDINVSTFNILKEDFNKLLSLFNNSNTVTKVENGNKYIWKFTTKSISESNGNILYFDLTKLDNIIFDDIYNKIYNIINKQIFNYDIRLDELLYDTTEIKISGTMEIVIENNKIVEEKINIIYNSSNEYQEGIQYTITAQVY